MAILSARARRHRPRRLLASLGASAGLLLAAAACGGDTPSGPGAGDDDSPMTAKIDGVVWAADPRYVSQAVVHNAPGIYVISGSKFLTSTNVLTILLTLYNVRGPGTYPLGVGANVVGGTGIVSISETSAGWSTPLSGASGTVTITTLTATRIVGTFDFTATPISGPSTGTKTVTEGRFDLPIPAGSVPPLPENAGSRFSATIGGAPWNAATIAVVAHPTTGLIVSATNASRFVSFSLVGVTAAGTYPLSATPPFRLISVLGPNGSSTEAPCCWATAAGSTGTVVITSFTSERVRGTFSGTLAPSAGSGATAPLVISGGEFDLGIPHAR
jgi:hypothetical protein